jgi:hypothetical protein
MAKEKQYLQDLHRKLTISIKILTEKLGVYPGPPEW